MINIVSGNILSVKEGLLVQQVNCMGVMGAGLAKQIRAKYPEIFPSYREFIDRETNKGNLPAKNLLGRVHLFSPNDNQLVVTNCFGQYDYGDGLRTDYEALKRALDNVRAISLTLECPVAIPWGLGCGMAGGDWNIVMKMLLELFDDKDPYFKRANATIYML